MNYSRRTAVGKILAFTTTAAFGGAAGAILTDSGSNAVSGIKKLTGSEPATPEAEATNTKRGGAVGLAIGAWAYYTNS